MLQLEKLLKADIMKLKSTQIVWMHLYIPILGLILFLSYYLYSPWDSISKISAYLQVLCMIFPILIGIITSMMADQEYVAGCYRNLLASSETRCLSFLSKLILVLAFGALSTIIAVLGFYIGYTFIEDIIFPFTMYLKVAGVLICSNIFLYILHFFLSLRFSKGISIGIGIVESLISALFLTGMGDGRWPFLPSSWSIRFISSLLMKYQNSGGAFRDPALTLGIMISIVGTILSLIIIVAWYTKWEGEKSEE